MESSLCDDIIKSRSYNWLDDRFLTRISVMHWPLSCVPIFSIWVGVVVPAVAGGDDRFTCDKPTGDAAIVACGLYQRGTAYYAKGDHDRAIADLNEAIRLEPNFVAALTARGTAYYAKRDYDRAIDEYSEAIRLYPKNAAAFYNRGSAYAAKGHQDDAIADYNEAIRLEPKFVAALISRGSAYYAKGDYDRAIAEYNEAIRLEPKFVVALTARGTANYAKGDYDRAIDDYSEAIGLYSKSPETFLSRGAAYVSRGGAYDEKGDHVRAIADFGEAIRLDPKNAAAFFNRGYAYNSIGDHERAMADYRQAIGLQPKLDHQIGVRIQRVTDAMAERLGMKRARGALIISVDATGPAKLAGIERGDVIVKIDGTDINIYTDMPRLLVDRPVGENILATVVRSGNELNKAIRLGIEEANAPSTTDPTTPSAMHAAPPNPEHH
jgi:tetratricopeptide (TPR) repeat protein